MTPRPPRRAALSCAGLAALLAVAIAPSPAGADDPAPAPSPAAAEMLKSMREKGILSEKEYEDLYRRQAEYEAQQQAQQGLPGWLRDWTFGGDIRFRWERIDAGKLHTSQVLSPGHQNVDALNLTASGVQDRWRLRLRIGAEKRIREGLTFGFRIATSSPVTYGNEFNYGGTSFATPLNSDPRSENVTFGNLFSLDSVFFDRAYLRWQPDFAPTFMAEAGKFGNPFIATDFPDLLVWDSDIQPEGLALDYRFDVEPERLWLTFTGGGFLVQNVGSVTLTTAPSGSSNQFVTTQPVQDDSDPYLFGVQAGVHVRPNSWIEAGARVSFYDMENVNQRVAAALEDLGNGGEAIRRNPLFVLLGPSSPYYTNGRSNGRLQELVVDAHATFEPWGERYRMTPFFQWTTLPEATSEDQGLVAGLDLGDPSLLELTLMWARLERNSTISLYTDSDIFDGYTNVEGFYVALTRRLAQGITLRGTWSHSQQLHNQCDAIQQGKPSALCDTASQISAFGAYRKTTLDRDRFQVDLTVDF